MSVAEVRAFLERNGLAARRGLGQNFLADAQLADRLVALAGVEPGQGVVEIGAGTGVLTRALAARGARVITVEVDAGLVRALRAESALPDGVTLIHGDALAVDLAALARDAGPGARVVANLPYAISAPLLRRLLDLREQLVDWSVMLQRDVAARLLAAPGSRDYGSLAVLHGLTVTLERGMELSPRCFFPVPRVRSTFVRMRPIRDAGSRGGDSLLVGACDLGREELARVETVARAAFSQRRKTLANALRGAGIQGAADALARAGLEGSDRAERIAPEGFRRLARALAESS